MRRPARPGPRPRYKLLFSQCQTSLHITARRESHFAGKGGEGQGARHKGHGPAASQSHECQMPLLKPPNLESRATWHVIVRPLLWFWQDQVDGDAPASVDVGASR